MIIHDSIPTMQYTVHTLPHGLRVVLMPMRGTETATVVVMTGTGSRYETERENGIAHFLEHMLFKGTERRPNAKAISEELDGIGAIYNAFTAKERTAYWAKVRKDYFSTALDVISDIFLHSTLPEQEIEKERGAIVQEIDMYEDMPMRTIDNVFDALFFGAGHPLGRTILGPKENIQTFTREDFIAYRTRNYTPENTVIAIAGSFDEKIVMETINRDFGYLKNSPPPDCAPFMLSQQEPRATVKEKNTDQTHFMLGVPAYPYLHEDEFGLEVLATILGASMSSRLFLEVREKRGLAYSIHAWTEKYPDTGYFATQAGVEHTKLEETVRVILEEFKKICNERVDESELKKAKSYLKGTLTLAMETSDAIAGNAATTLINLGRVRSLDDVIEGIEKVTAADVQRIACDILQSNRLNLAVIGPLRNADHLRSLLSY